MGHVSHVGPLNKRRHLKVPSPNIIKITEKFDNFNQITTPKNAVGEMRPVLLATTMEVPLSRNGTVKSTTASLSAFILSEVRTMSNFFAISAAISPFHFPF